ncbi:MAG TPA: hypothetical protein VNV62_02235 [Trebonia sp.]|jgi:hypothetical protein|nr:hypothetical protein [Trebonia sp.]
MATIIKSANPAARKPYTVRYRDSLGSQRERSFTTRGQAATFANDQERAKRYGGDVDLSASKKSFNDAVEVWLANTGTLSEASRRDYESVCRTWVKPAYAGLTVQDASNRPHVAEKLLNRTMIHLGQSRRVIARLVIVGTLNRLVRDGVIPSHRCVGIRLAAPAVTEDDTEGEDGGFVHLADAQVTVLAEHVGICVWLQRTMGLRIREALGVEKKDFIDGGKTLRLRWQSSRDGHSRVPLKKRRAGQYRDIPVPAFVWNLVKDMPERGGPCRTTRALRPVCDAQDLRSRHAGCHGPHTGHDERPLVG